MNILACLDRPTGGQYILNGDDVSNLNRTELARIRGRELGFVFQSFNLLPRMSAMENVMLPLMYRPDKPTTIPQRKELAMQVLNSVGLGERAHHLPSELSGGQQQRVAIARVLINEPILILADEPTGNLDSTSGMGIMHLLSDLHQQGKTILVVTHDPRMQHFATQTIYLLDGKVVDPEAYEAATKTMYQS